MSLKLAGEMLKGTRATYGLEPRCVEVGPLMWDLMSFNMACVDAEHHGVSGAEVTAEVTNPEERVLKKARIFRYVFS